MKTLHTPGPWKTKDPFLFITANGIDICEIIFIGDGTAEPNAKLIAAAPELLVALKECIRVYEETRDAQPTGHLWPDPNHIFHARNTIKKAEGHE
jgi:hypothetical protein